MAAWADFGRILEALNRYANLLLVFITATYVWLTWRTLKALQRSSQRERELKHLEDIKQHVVRPLIQWLDQEAEFKLKGNSPVLQVKTCAVPKANVAIGEWAWDYLRQLDHTLTDSWAFSSDLYSHARGVHFPEQMANFEAFLGELRQLGSDFVVFTRECADKIAASTSLRRAAVVDSLPEGADSDSLVEVCLRDLIMGRPVPQLGYQAPAAEALQLNDALIARPLGRGPTERVKDWVEGGVALIQEGWAKRSLGGRIGRLLAVAADVHQALERLEFTYGLPQDCEYIGGKAPGPFISRGRPRHD